MKLLLVEDEVGLSDALSYMLKKNGYVVDTAYDGISGQEMAETGIYDLIILDRMLPGKEGVSVLSEIRNEGITTPVIFLTARDAVKDRVEGLDAGADDYLVKPFSTEELLARIRALSRRQSTQVYSEKLQVASLMLDPLKCEVVCRDKIIKLTLKECQILEVLIRNSGQVITKEQMLNRVWGPLSDVEFNNVEIYIYFLRKKLNSKICGISIETVRGIGYCLKEIEGD